MKVVTLEVVLLVDDDFDPEESGELCEIVSDSLAHTDEYDDQAFKSIQTYNVNQISERDYEDD